MKRICIAAALLLALTACKTNAPKQSTPSSNSDDPGITMVGPRLGFDGKIKLGCCSPGFGF